MKKLDINKVLNIIFSLSDEVTPLTLETNIRIMLGWKPAKFNNIDAQKEIKVAILINKVCV